MRRLLATLALTTVAVGVPTVTDTSPVDAATGVCGMSGQTGLHGSITAGCFGTPPATKWVQAHSSCLRPDGSRYNLPGPKVLGLNGNVSVVGCFGNLGDIVVGGGFITLPV